MNKLSDQEVFLEYAELLKLPVKEMSTDLFQSCVFLVKLARKDEPRINSGIHYHDYSMICDTDDTMDSFYGSNYFEKTS